MADTTFPNSHESHLRSPAREHKLADLPHEILLLILSHFNLGTAVLASLTCKRLYFAYKDLHPNLKVSLSEHCCKGPMVQMYRSYWEASKISLGDLLENWIGPKYRRHDWSHFYFGYFNYNPLMDPPQYLLRAAYGDYPSWDGECKHYMREKEHALGMRYQDYHMAVRTNPLTGEHENILPQPFNAGKKWFKGAKRAIFADALTRTSWVEWMGFWWEHSDFFCGMAYREKLKALQMMERPVRHGIVEKVLGAGDVVGWVRRLRRQFYRRLRYKRRYNVAEDPQIGLEPFPPPLKLKIDRSA